MTQALETTYEITVGAQLTLHLLGSPRIEYMGQPLVFAYEKAQALLVYLAVEAGRIHRRTALADLLWPEHTTSAARHNLSQALFTLRRTLGGDGQNTLLLSSRDSVRLNPACAIWVDVTAFQTLLSSANTEHLEQASALYRSDFLTASVLAIVPFLRSGFRSFANNSTGRLVMCFPS